MIIHSTYVDYYDFFSDLYFNSSVLSCFWCFLFLYFDDGNVRLTFVYSFDKALTVWHQEELLCKDTKLPFTIQFFCGKTLCGAWGGWMMFAYS